MRISRLREINVIQKRTSDIQLRIGLVYPNSYSVGMSGLSVKLLYHLLNQHQNIYTERIFFSEKLPGPPKSIETGKTLPQFDLLAFTFQFELDYINAIKMLMRSNIPVFSKDRNSNHPLLLAGGPTITTNPEPLLDIFDLFFSGEFESVAYPFLKSVISNKHSNLIDMILSVPGFYSSQESISNVYPLITSNLDDVNYPTAQVRPISVLSRRKGTLDGYLLQVSRGCKHNCHFCLVGKHFRPWRERSFTILKNLINSGIKNTKTDFFSLIGSSTADYSKIKDLIAYLIEKEAKFSLPSIRVDSGIELLELIKKTGLKSLSIAPESAVDDIRNKIGKKISNSQIIEFIKKSDENKIRQLKLYYILGLTSDPVSESQELLNFITNLIDQFPSMQFTISANPLIPKKGTKLDNQCIDYEEVKSGFSLLKHKLGKQIRLKSFPIHWATIQAILSIGGRELTPNMIEIANKGGSYLSWKKYLKDEPHEYYLKNYCN